MESVLTRACRGQTDLRGKSRDVAVGTIPKHPCWPQWHITLSITQEQICAFQDTSFPSWRQYACSAYSLWKHYSILFTLTTTLPMIPSTSFPATVLDKLFTTLGRRPHPCKPDIKMLAPLTPWSCPPRHVRILTASGFQNILLLSNLYPSQNRAQTEDPEIQSRTLSTEPAKRPSSEEGFNATSKVPPHTSGVCSQLCRTCPASPCTRATSPVMGTRWQV